MSTPDAPATEVAGQPLSLDMPPIRRRLRLLGQRLMGVAHRRIHERRRDTAD
jgi:hypothetical protein